MDLLKKRSHRYLAGIYALFILVLAITLSLFYNSRIQKSTHSGNQDTDIVRPEDSSDNLQKVTKKIDIKKGQLKNKYETSESDDKVYDEHTDTSLSTKDDLNEQRININGSQTPLEEDINPKDNQIQTKLPSISSRQNAVIYFSAESTGLTDEALEKLKTIYLFLVKDPEDEIIIAGYGDSNKTNRDDKILSKLRANVVKDYFVKRDISDSRIKTCWMGSENRTECRVFKEDKNKTHQVEVKFKLGSQE